MKFEISTKKPQYSSEAISAIVGDYPVAPNPNIVAYKASPKVSVIMTAVERARLEQHVESIKARTIKSFNIQFITSKDDNVKNDVVTMYQMNCDEATRKALSSSEDPIGALLTCISAKSNDFKAMVEECGLVHVAKLSASRRSKTFTKGQCPFFNVIIHGYVAR